MPRPGPLAELDFRSVDALSDVDTLCCLVRNHAGSTPTAQAVPGGSPS